MIRRAAVGIVINPERRVLMARRSFRLTRYPGQWEFPGGAARIRESLLEALTRELWEEVGLVVEGRPTLVRNGQSRDGDGVSWATSTFLVDQFSGIPHIREPEKCEALEYFEIGKLPSPMMDSARADIASLEHLIGH